jgi:hypothetical protein
MILPKRGRVHVGKTLEFVYKTVTILQGFTEEKTLIVERSTPTPLLCVVKLIIQLIAIKNNDPSRMPVMEIGLAKVSSMNCSRGKAKLPL